MISCSLPALRLGSSLFLLLNLLLKFGDGLGRLVQLLVKQDVEVTARVVQEVLNEAAIEEVAMDVQLLVPINHVLVLERVRRVPNSSILRLSWLVSISCPLLFQVCLRVRG